MSVTGWFSRLMGSESEQTTCTESTSDPALVDPFFLSTWPEGTRIYEEFDVEREIGTGNLGPIYTVRSLQDERHYVVKRAKLPNSQVRGEFHSLMTAWACLPEHPNLCACRFVRCHETEEDLFLEPLSGTSLKDAIESKRLYEGGDAAALERILDISIQMAWGLQALEDFNLVHGDLMPAHVFLTGKNQVKITDIGWARATTHASCPDGKPVPPFTSAYSAPEVQDVSDVASDLWSLALIVLEMFSGSAIWVKGPQEPSQGEAQDNAEKAEPLLTVLKTFAQQPAQKPRPAIPPGVVDLLQHCLAPRVADRCASAIEASMALRKVYREHVGREYGRVPPSSMHRCNQLAIAHARWCSASGAQWSSPKEWEDRIQRAMGCPVAIRPSPRTDGLSLQAKAAHDHVALEGIQAQCEKRIAEGHPELRHELAGLWVDHGFLHVGLQDIKEALTCFERATGIWENMVEKEQRRDLVHELAMAHLNRATALKHLNRWDDALSAYEKAKQLWTVQVSKEGHRELAATLGWAEALNADVLFNLAAQQMGQAAVLKKKAQEVDVPEQDTSVQTLKKKVEALKTQEAAMRAAHTASTGGSSTPNTERTSCSAALQDLESERAQLEKALQEAEALEAERKAKQKAAGDADQSAKTLQKRAEGEARTAVSVLQSETKRTDREDVKAVLNWANRVFEGLL